MLSPLLLALFLYPFALKQSWGFPENAIPEETPLTEGCKFSHFCYLFFQKLKLPSQPSVPAQMITLLLRRQKSSILRHMIANLHIFFGSLSTD